MKKFLSSLLAAVMVVGSMATVAFADGETSSLPTSNGIWANGTSFASIDSAAASLSSTGGTIYVYGEVEVDGRQTISYDGITLEGLNGGALVASDNFKNSSETNRKAVLTIGTTGTTYVKNLTIDGTKYDNTLASASTYDFKVVRINGGTTNFDNVTISGSKRGLMQVGITSTAATVNATNLTANAELKTISDVRTYADILVVNGAFNMSSGNVNAYISTDWETGNGSLNVSADGYFTFENSYLTKKYYVCATPAYIAETYFENGSLSEAEVTTYGKALAKNDSETKKMMRYVRNNKIASPDVFTNVRNMVVDMQNNTYIKLLYSSKFATYLKILDGTIQ